MPPDGPAVKASPSLQFLTVRLPRASAHLPTHHDEVVIRLLERGAQLRLVLWRRNGPPPAPLSVSQNHRWTGGPLMNDWKEHRLTVRFALLRNSSFTFLLAYLWWPRKNEGGLGG